MKTGVDRERVQRRERLQGYVVLVLAGALLIFVLWAIPNVRRPTGTPGFGPDWTCMGASMKGGGFCVRSPAPGKRAVAP